MTRIRIHHTKNILLQYTGTLDVQKIWERTLRRAMLPIGYSQGFHPQPKIQLASPLPLGMTSKSEYVDFWLENDPDITGLTEMISNVKHPGMDILDIQRIPETEPSLQSRLSSVVYRAILPDVITLEEIEPILTAMLLKESIILERRGKDYDLRPLVESCVVSLNQDSGKIEILMTLSARPGATGRPEEVLKVLGFDPFSVKFERQAIIFEPIT